jgi:hypothetical protein
VAAAVDVTILTEVQEAAVLVAVVLAVEILRLHLLLLILVQVAAAEETITTPLVAVVQVLS